MSKDLINLQPSEIITWGEKQPWAQLMKECDQDIRFHEEGNVWNHTLRVCQALTESEEWEKLESEKRTILFLGALFHDIGKPKTTNVTENGIEAKNHSLVGAKITRKILAGSNTPVNIREHIVNLVRYHTSPPNLLKRKNPLFWALKLSFICSTRDLYLLSKCDGLGRTSKSKDDFLERVELFREFCLENKCFDNRYPFASDFARFLYFQNKLTSINYMPYEEFICEVTILSGLPAAGKDFWIKKQNDNLTEISLDKIRKRLGIKPTQNQGKVIQAARNEFRSLLRNKQSFIFNATNTVKSTREKWIRLAHQYGAKVRIVYIERDISSMLLSNSKREYPIPESTWWKLFDKLEVPEITEAHEVIYLDNISRIK